MNKLSRRPYGHEQGLIAVEFAIVTLFVLVPLLAAALFFGRFVWHYEVAEKAAHDAARFMATASPTELQTQSPVTRAPYIVGAAEALAYTEIAELNPGRLLPAVHVYCDSGPCDPNNEALPQTVSVNVTMRVQDPFLSDVSAMFNAGDALDLRINATAKMYYAGK